MIVRDPGKPEMRRWFVLLTDDPVHVLPNATCYSSRETLAKAQAKHPGSRTREVLTR